MSLPTDLPIENALALLAGTILVILFGLVVLFGKDDGGDYPGSS